MDLSHDTQKQIATFTPEAGLKHVRKGDKFLGSYRTIGDDLNQCVCGLCFRTQNQPSTECTLFTDGGTKLVQRQQTELCRPLCISKGPVRMLQRLIRTLFRDIDEIQTRRGEMDQFIRISLQRDDSTYEKNTGFNEMGASMRPYVFDAFHEYGYMYLSFFADLSNLAHSQFRIRYRIGDRLEFSSFMNEQVLTRVKYSLEQTLIEGNGRKFSLVVTGPYLPNLDTEIRGLRLKFDPNFHVTTTLRARPVFLFVQAHPRARAYGKDHMPEL
jgi:hypothetical protein